MMGVGPGCHVLGRLVLHIGSHLTESASSASPVDWRFTVASVVIVGGIGSLLYWYYARQAEPGQSASLQSRKQ